MKTTENPTRRFGAERGFGYMLVLFALAGLGMMLAGAGQVWHTTLQREKEIELLFIGHQFRLALASYRRATPSGGIGYPLQLENLVEDKRFPTPQRHLRRIYRDPMTGVAEWGLVKSGPSIVGIHSLSTGEVLKSVLPGRDAELSGTTHYGQWVFGPANIASGS